MANELDKVVEDSARGGFFLMSGSILSTVIMAIAAILVGRLLGPALYGEYALALVIPTLLSIFGDFGINTGTVKFAASLRSRGENEQIRKIILTGLLFQALVGLGISGVSFAFADFFAVLINRPGLSFYIQIMSISILFQTIYAAVMSIFVGLDKTEYNALTGGIQAAAKTVSSIALVLLGFSVAGAALGYVTGYAVACIIGVGIVFFKILRPLKKGDKGDFIQTLKMLVNYGTPLYITVLLIGFMPLYQQVILAFFASNFEVGNFRAAANFLTLISTIPSSITSALLPAFSKLDFLRAEGLTVFFKRANKYTCLLIVPIATLVIILSEEVVRVVYGSAYQSASLFLLIGCLSYFLAGLGYLTLSSLFNGLGETRTTLKITAVNCFIILVLAPILVSAYGVPGVMLTSLLSNAIAITYGAIIARTRFKIEFDVYPTIKIYLVSAASAIPSLLLLRFTSLSDLVALVAGGVLYLLVYITLVPLAKIIGYYELQKATQVIQKIRILAPIARPVLKYQEKILRLRTVEQPP
jgi:O-antigen/teichoic acid export membrane protein